ncbi:MAG: 50S ribosomal protein L3 [Acidobacteria bacterium]|nr:MAG: 50S ribosomal protein L3 [Acidobacteriota bacterium]
MVNGLIGRKIGMTQVFDDQGNHVPVTVIQAGPCVVVGHRNQTRDGYEAVQIGLVEHIAAARLSKPRRGQFEKHKLPPMRHVQEFLVVGGEKPAVGEKFLADLFQPLDLVDIIGNSKGKGFQGVMKRHGFGGGKATHGSMHHRGPGSIGQSAYPSRVFRGMKGPGQMGNRRITVKNLEVVQVDAEKNMLVIKGAVPGAPGAYLTIRRSQRPPKKAAPTESS